MVEKRFDFSITNYVSMVAKAIGIDRDDRFKRYMLWGDMGRILKDADDHILESPFKKERIVEVLQKVFVIWGGHTRYRGLRLLSKTGDFSSKSPLCANLWYAPVYLHKNMILKSADDATNLQFSW